MKRFAAVLAVAAFFAGAVYAFAADVYTYEAKNGNVTFNHKAHAEKLGDCAKCHEGTPGPIDVTKDWAHQTCTGCHKEMNGPAKCNECHKK
ncbi:cytochrome c3 family protein [Geoalkalibacter sp.]|uniref:cytochrome c3 family protein n=1 Tax=Geoalkalibacter sp. TaxID=3041440 RepID=UPI00272ECEB9|nr:cytochrome c3 family protein [Geoalkalibacter sp.]